MLQDATRLKLREEYAVQIVSFFTIEFYADDATGKTLRKQNLKELYEKTQSLKYLGVSSQKQNIIYLPQPSKGSANEFVWVSHKDQLTNRFKEINGNIQFEFKKLYMRMECGTFTIQK